MPVFVLTGIDDRGLALALGAADHLPRPVERTRLAALLAGGSGRSASARGVTPLAGVFKRGAMAKLLLVEDNEYNRDMLVRRLNKKGFEVVVAVDGGEGVAKARSEKPDLILMDMHLPVLDGWEATRQIKETEATRRSPSSP